MTRPAASPLFATDSVFASGPEVGLSVRLDPGSGIRAQGVLAESRYAARWENHTKGTQGDWIAYLDAQQAAMQATNWPERSTSGALFSAPAVNSNVALSALVLASGLTVLLALSTSKDVEHSHDGGNTWSVGTNLGGGSTTKPELAVGKVDGVPVAMANSANGGNNSQSLDGATWTSGSGNVGTGNNPCIAYAESLNLWLIVGTGAYRWTGTAAGMGSGGTGAVGLGTWAANSGGCKRLIWNGSVFVALPVSSYDKCLTSSDGITWAERSLGSTQVWTGLAYSSTEGVWLAISDGGAVTKSPDGITWTVVGSFANAVATDLAVLGTLWVATTRNGDYGGIAYSQDRGATWANATVGNHLTATSGWNRISQVDSRFIVAHQTGATNTEFQLSLRRGG
jgi:hypothetical protein